MKVWNKFDYRYCPILLFCEYRNESSDSIKGAEFLARLGNYHLSKKDQ
jgi:hypothetical protein